MRVRERKQGSPTHILVFPVVIVQKLPVWWLKMPVFVQHAGGDHYAARRAGPQKGEQQRGEVEVRAVVGTERELNPVLGEVRLFVCGVRWEKEYVSVCKVTVCVTPVLRGKGLNS